MKKTILVLLVSTTSFCLCCCQKNGEPSLPKALFDSVPVIKQLSPVVNELSGIADSKTNPGYLWGQVDSGNPNEIYLIRHDGTVVKKIYVKGITNRDWEDMSLADGAIYIAETGDNARAYTNYMIYKFAEPSMNTDTVSAVQTISFTYPDGSHDAEALLVDESKNIYIITKSDIPSKIYKLAYPYDTNNTVSLMGSLPYGGVVSATMNANEIIVKTYPSLFYYKRQKNQSIEQTLKTDYTSLPYVLEPQGEAVSFANNGSGYYTISEKNFGTTV
ncbi:MAG TPA: hypothetical protein VL095_00950, partial [Flavisolibacter sp.]|nr:hypothetical protein [Flavisolibacter sp.]